MRDNTPSRTALKVAFIVILLGGDEYGRNQCPPGAIDAQWNLLQSCRLSFLPRVLLQNPIVSKLSRWSSSALVHPHLMEGVGIRKCFMEHHVRRCLDDGKNNCRQVLIIGAGYDTMAWRLSNEYPHVQFWEVDHPATSQVKQRGLKRMAEEEEGRRPPNLRPNNSKTNLHTVMADLTRTTLEQVLSQHEDYNVGATTVVVMEGLLYYLSERQVKQLFASVANVVGRASPSSVVCFDFFGWNGERNRLDLGWMTPLLSWSIKLVGEPWKWGIDPTELEAFFDDDTAWKVSVMPTSIGIERLACVQLRSNK